VDLAVEAHQAVDFGIDDKDDGSAVAAISSIGAALGHMLFAPKADHTSAAVTAFDVNFCFVEEHLGYLLSAVGRCVVARTGWGAKRPSHKTKSLGHAKAFYYDV
jgi:hypothetical protein